jgi:hypothetical protein
MTEQENKFIQLGRIYLNLIYQQKQYEVSNKKPPNDLVDGIATLEQQIRHFLDVPE